MRIKNMLAAKKRTPIKRRESTPCLPSRYEVTDGDQIDAELPENKLSEKLSVGNPLIVSEHASVLLLFSGVPVVPFWHRGVSWS